MSASSDTDNREADAKKTKTGGRIPHTAYVNAIDHSIKNSALKYGDYCPTGCGGKLYEPKPCVKPQK